jgi:6-phosphogluconolactonase
MTTKVVPGILIATPDAEQAYKEAASRMARCIRDAVSARGRAAIALSGGNTPKPAYAQIAKDPKIDWSRVDVFFVDERAVPPTSDRSNFRMVREALIDPAKIADDHVFRMRGEESDLEESAREYEAQIKKTLRTGLPPSFDLVVLGVGDDGHTASLFPGRPEVEITDRLVVAVPSHAGLEPRITLTAPIIEAARHVMVMALGKSKHDPLERVWEVSGSKKDTPARLVRDVRGAITWVIDRAAGGMG